MPARNRSRIFRAPIGRFDDKRDQPPFTNSGGNDSSTTQSGSMACADSTSTRPYPDHTLDITRKRLVSPRLNGTKLVLSPVESYTGVYSGFRLSPFTIGTYPNLPAPSWNYFTTKALANLNPNVPLVDIPLFLFELREFPRMLKQLGDVLGRRISPSTVPQSWLSFQFGWRPLFSDLYKMLSLAEALEAQKRYLLNAQKKGGHRLRRKLGKIPINLSPTNMSGALHSTTVCSGLMTYTGEENYWFTARINLLSPLHGSSLDTAAFRSLLGLNLSAASIWNALPWSWLIDYFVNVGDYLDANRGYIKFRTQRLNLMCHQRVRGEFSANLVKPQLSVSAGRLDLEYKGRRLPSVVTPRLAFRPYLSGTMLANLGALITSAALKSSR